jgi:hypothetical protein
MRTLFTAAFVISGAVACATASAFELGRDQREAVIKAYRAMTPEQIEAKKVEAAPAHITFARVDVSARMRSASFGHTTTLLVPEGAREFWVEYGRSTNHPAELFGPFPVAPSK